MVPCASSGIGITRKRNQRVPAHLTYILLLAFAALPTFYPCEAERIPLRRDLRPRSQGTVDLDGGNGEGWSIAEGEVGGRRKGDRQHCSDYLPKKCKMWMQNAAVNSLVKVCARSIWLSAIEQRKLLKVLDIDQVWTVNTVLRACPRSCRACRKSPSEMEEILPPSMMDELWDTGDNPLYNARNEEKIRAYRKHIFDSASSANAFRKHFLDAARSRVHTGQTSSGGLFLVIFFVMCFVAGLLWVKLRWRPS